VDALSLSDDMAPKDEIIVLLMLALPALLPIFVVTNYSG
jgi:hypothetical protein